MAAYDKGVAVTLVSVAGFQLLQAWNTNAPSLSELRSAPSHDVCIRQKLMDADFMVGGLAVILGVAYATVTHDLTAMTVMLTIFGAVSLWHHAVLNAEER